MEPESLMILYEDNSVEVQYIDRSRLLLSPCGSEFLFEKAVPASAHPIQPPERVRQRTQFAISIYQEKLLQALDFRNQYSERPYLPSDIIPPERKSIFFMDITEAKWPSHQTADETIQLVNGGVKVSSLDGHASLFLPELRQEFTVEFLCNVSQKTSTQLPFLKRSSSISVQDCHGSSNQSPDLKSFSRLLRTGKKDTGGVENSVPEFSDLNQKDDTISWTSQKSSYEYSRVIQHISVSSCPEEWKYPLSLAFRISQSHNENEIDFNEGNKEGDVGPDVSTQCRMAKAITGLPLALPLSCHAPYLHRWTFTDSFQQRKERDGYYFYSQPVKVLWNKGIIYRFFLGQRSIEIYPSDGSVFKSEGSFLGKYFTRYTIQEHTKQREGTVYFVNSLPPDVPGNPYSVWTIITQSVRILQHNLENMLSLTHNYHVCCWKLSPETGRRGMLPLPLAEQFIPYVGRFFAYSDKKVHALFCDGMVLNMEWDFISQDDRSQKLQGVYADWCKLTSPEGTQHLFQIDHPGPYERYITAVVDWCKSLNKGREMCTDTQEPIHEQSWSVAAELEKIRRFNFLVENSNIPSLVSTNSSSNVGKESTPKEVFFTENISIKNITETLEKTSKVINDIDFLLTSSANHTMK